MGEDYRYSYDLSKAKISSGGACELPVDISIICPKCGKLNFYIETVFYTIDNDNRKESTEKAIVKHMNKYFYLSD